MSDTSAPIDLREAASRLGVHYQTAYGWIRSGSLPAERVRGRYRIDPQRLADFSARRDRPRRPPVRRPRGGYEELRTRFYGQLIDGQAAATRRLAAELLERGVERRLLIDELLAPAMRRIGEEWSRGGMSVAVEHRAACIVQTILGEQSPPPRGRPRGTAAVAAVTPERHSLPVQMASMALREDGWRVHDLGADLPQAELLAFCGSGAVDFVALAVASPSAAGAAASAAAELAELGVPCLEGSPGAALEPLLAWARSPSRHARGV